MKRTYIRIIGIILVLILLTTGAFVPAKPASAGTLAWTTVNTPNPGNLQLYPNSDVDFLVMAPDGNTMFSYDNKAATTLAVASLAGATVITLTSTAGFPASGRVSVGSEGDINYTAVVGATLTGIPVTGYGSITRAHFVGDTVSVGTLLKSYDGGTNWTSTNIGAILNGLMLTSLAISSDYANDSTIIAAVQGVDNGMAFDLVYRSIDGGQTLGPMPGITAIAPATMTISSIAVGAWYKGGQAILVGYASNTGAGTGGASLFTTLDLTWLNLATVAGWNAGVTGGDVSGVAFSPKHKVDAQLMVLSSTAAGGTWLKTRFGTNAFDTDVDVASASAEFKNDNGARIPSAVAGGMVGAFAFPDDYDWAGNNRIIVGIGNTGTVNVDDVYRYHGALAGGQTRVYDLNATGTGSSVTNVYSIAFKGNFADGTCVVGQRDNKTIIKSTNISGSPVSWVTSTKNPTGDVAVGAPRTIVLTSPTSTDIFAGTQGVGSALSVSTNGGVSFDALSLIDISGTAAATNLQPTSTLIPVDANTTFLLMWDDADASLTKTPGDNYLLFKTTNAGVGWKLVFATRQTGALDSLSGFNTTRTYTTDQTIYGWQSDVRFWKSSDGGATWWGYTAPANITAFGIIDKDTYFTGHANAVYKSGRPAVTGTLDGETATMIKQIDASTIAVGTGGAGTAGGDVLLSTDDGVTFSRLGPNDSLGSGMRVNFAADPGYLTNKLIYAASGAGLFRWTVGQSSTWEQFNGVTDSFNNVDASPDGTLYCGSAIAGNSILRQVNPTLPLAKINGLPVVPPAVSVESPFEYMKNNGITGFDPAATISNFRRFTAGGSNTLYAIVRGVAAGSYGYGYRLLTITDNMANPPQTTAPTDNASTGTTVTLTWSAISSPVPVSYAVDVALDAIFTNRLVGTPFSTTSTSYTLNGLSAGTQYFWKVYVNTASPLRSRASTVKSFTVAGDMPSVATNAATAVTSTSATLNGNLLSRGTAETVNVSFEWGLDTTYGNTTTAEPKTATGTFSANISGLTVGNTYHFRSKTTGNGTSYGGDATFTTAQKTLQSIHITPVNPSVAKGRTLLFTATGTYNDDSTGNITDEVAWSSSNPVVAAIGTAPPPYIIPNPTSGLAGSSFNITGSNFAANSSGVIWFDSNNNGAIDTGEPQVSVTTTTTGAIPAGITLTVPAVSAGYYPVLADIPTGGAIEATSNFYVYVPGGPGGGGGVGGGSSPTGPPGSAITFNDLTFPWKMYTTKK